MSNEIDNQCFPNLAIKTDARIRLLENGNYQWVMQVHIEGPDDVETEHSAEFETKRQATTDMLIQYDRVMGKLHKRLSQ